MRLNEVTKLTGLTKKAIHFYIDEQLISPLKNTENGYYDFAVKDLKKLQQIALFRKIGLPIQAIKEAYQYPTLFNYFLHKQVNALKHNISEQLQTLNSLDYLINNVPPNVTPYDLYDFELKTTPLDDSIINQCCSVNDARMIAILVWTPFLNIEVDEYRQFLWDKISNELKLEFNDNLIYIKRLIYTLNAQQIDLASLRVYRNFQFIKQANNNICDTLALELFEKVRALANNPELLQKWLLLKKPVLSPVISLYHSSSSNLLKEYNPDFILCFERLDCICQKTLQLINKDLSVKQYLSDTLDIDFDKLAPSMNELTFILSFEDSIYNCLTIDELNINVFKN